MNADKSKIKIKVGIFVTVFAFLLTGLFVNVAHSERYRVYRPSGLTISSNISYYGVRGDNGSYHGSIGRPYYGGTITHRIMADTENITDMGTIVITEAAIDMGTMVIAEAMDTQGTMAIIEGTTDIGLVVTVEEVGTGSIRIFGTKETVSAGMMITGSGDSITTGVPPVIMVKLGNSQMAMIRWLITENV